MCPERSVQGLVIINGREGWNDNIYSTAFAYVEVEKSDS